MVIILRSLAMAGIVTSSQEKPLSLLFADFKTFLTPQAIDSLEVDPPTLLPQQYGDPTITVPRMLHMQYQNIVDYRFVLFGLLRVIPLSTAALA